MFRPAEKALVALTAHHSWVSRIILSSFLWRLPTLTRSHIGVTQPDVCEGHTEKRQFHDKVQVPSTEAKLSPALSRLIPLTRWNSLF